MNEQKILEVAGELVLGMFLSFLAISVFFKAYILHLSLLAYLPEGILLTLVGSETASSRAQALMFAIW